MSKSDTMAAIMRINRSAPAEFLADFSVDDLQCYLDRLATLRPAPRASDRPELVAQAHPAPLPVLSAQESPLRLTPVKART